MNAQVSEPSSNAEPDGDTGLEALQESGPIDYLVIEFPGSKMTGEAFPALLKLVDQGIIRILDLVFVSRATDGSVTALEIADLDGDGQLDLAIFEGASSGLLERDDIEEASSVLEPGSSAGILVYENVWAAPFATAVRRSGGQLVASGRIPIQAILARLDEAEAAVAEADAATASA
jgi:hypothetical protein